MVHEMSIYGFTLDTSEQMPVVILKDTKGEHSLPVWITTEEAVAIAVEIITSDIITKTGGGDVMTRMLDQLRLLLERISIDDVNDGVFTSTLLLSGAQESVTMPVRPSEAIVMSLKYRLPIRIEDEVLSRVSSAPLSEAEIPVQADAQKYLEMLEGLSPDKLNKYPM